MSKVLIDRELLERITSNNFFGSSAIDELRTLLAQPAADCGLEVVGYALGREAVVRKSDADARDAMRLERIAELESDVAKWKALTETSQAIAEISQNSTARMAALKAQEPVAEILVSGSGMIVDAVRRPSELAPGFHKLYATPVKQEVVMPGRQDATNPQADFVLFQRAIGWNECLDEVARLNGGKP